MRVNRVMLSLLGAAVMVLLMLAFLGLWAGPTTLSGRSALAAPVSQASGFGLILSGPDTAPAHQAVTYTLQFTLSAGSHDYLELWHYVPVSFTVSSTEPVTTSRNGSQLVWTASRLSGHDTVTIVGAYSESGGCLPFTHYAEFNDPYNPDLPSDTYQTIVGGCVYLPATLRNYH
jgi:hypothetical protein